MVASLERERVPEKQGLSEERKTKSASCSLDPESQSECSKSSKNDEVILVSDLRRSSYGTDGMTTDVSDVVVVLLLLLHIIFSVLHHRQNSPLLIILKESVILLLATSHSDFVSKYTFLIIAISSEARLLPVSRFSLRPFATNETTTCGE